MNIMIVGASRGLGRALAEGLGRAGDTVVGVSRRRPDALAAVEGVQLEWIEADLSVAGEAASAIEAQAPAELDVLICNVGLWEEEAFSEAIASSAIPTSPSAGWST